jgi:hypothetical protein
LLLDVLGRYVLCCGWIWVFALRGWVDGWMGWCSARGKLGKKQKEVSLAGSGDTAVSCCVCLFYQGLAAHSFLGWLWFFLMKISCSIYLLILFSGPVIIYTLFSSVHAGPPR